MWIEVTASDQIRLNCKRLGSEPALSLGGLGPDIISYERLGYHVDAVSARLQHLGVVPGLIYGVHYEAPVTHVVLILALERLGAVSATVRDEADCNAIELAGVFSDRRFAGTRCRVTLVTGDWLFADPELAVPATRAVTPDQLCRISFTSGSTGRPKPVVLTYGMRAERARNQDLAYGAALGGATRRLCSIGINTGFGYRMLVRTLCDGGLFCFPDGDVPRTARRIQMYGVQGLMGSPLQLADLASHGQANPGAFSSLKFTLCIGSRLSDALAEKLRRHVCSLVMVSYGSSEGGIAAAGSVEDLDLLRGDVGRVIASVQVEILDEAGRPRVGSVGRIRIKSDGVAYPSIGDGTLPDANFDGDWFYPGDIGMLSADGMLSILGREDNVVNVGGVKTTSEKIEAELLAGPGVSDVAVIAMADRTGISRITAFVVPRNDWSEVAFSEYCGSRLNATIRPVKIYLLRELPRTPNGKVDRQALPALIPT